jgi:hypothetical protein
MNGAGQQAQGRPCLAAVEANHALAELYNHLGSQLARANTVSERLQLTVSRVFGSPPPPNRAAAPGAKEPYASTASLGDLKGRIDQLSELLDSLERQSAELDTL